MTTHRTALTTMAVALCLAGSAAPGAQAATGASSEPRAATHARATPVCMAADLSARQTSSAAGMSQPAVYVTVSNAGDRPCVLRGYPRLTGAWTSAGRQQITVTRGNVMNAPEASVTRVVLAPGGKAWFAIGSGTAYDSPIVTFRRIGFATAADDQGSVLVRVSLQANAPTGKPYPLGVTAFTPGTAPSGD